MVNKEMKFLDNGDIRYEVVDEAARTGLANKITSPTTSGTEGQVLTIDANGNPKWDGTSFIQVTDDGQGFCGKCRSRYIINSSSIIRY